MVSKSALNKLLKRDLVKICTEQSINIPKTVKTKKDYIDFMVQYKNWNPPLENYLDGHKKKPIPSKRPKPDNLAKLQKQLNDVEQKIQKIASNIKPPIRLESFTNQLVELEKKISQIESIKKPPSTTYKIETMMLRLVEIENEILEAIPSEEFVFLDDIYEFLDNISIILFTSSIKRLVLTGTLEYQEEESNIIVELLDGTRIGSVKKRFY